MKRTVFILTFILLAQMTHAQKNNDPYSDLWKKVAQLEQEQLTKSALEVVSTIAAKAKKEQNTGETIKALLYSCLLYTSPSPRD